MPDDPVQKNNQRVLAHTPWKQVHDQAKTAFDDPFSANTAGTCGVGCACPFVAAPSLTLSAGDTVSSPFGLSTNPENGAPSSISLTRPGGTRPSTDKAQDAGENMRVLGGVAW